MDAKSQAIRDNFEKLNFRNQLVWLNAGNPAGRIQIELCERILDEFPEDKLVGLEIGSAYGGGVEFLAKCWYGRGKVYGYDTFEGHPRDLADNQDDKEAWCMDIWYDNGKHVPQLNAKCLDYNYQRKILDDQLLNNVTLVKGRINSHSFDDIKQIHFAMIDLDLIKPTVVAYNAIKDKFVPGAYLMLHDSLSPQHLPKIYHFVYDVVVKDGRWNEINDTWNEIQTVAGMVTVLKRKIR